MTSSADTSAPAVQPQVGDTVHVIGNGPATFLEGDLSGSKAVYKVRYPDGTKDTVSAQDVLVSERKYSKGASGREQLPRPLNCTPCLTQTARDSNAEGSRRFPPDNALLGSPRGPRQLEYLGRAFDDSRRNIATPSATFSLVATMVGGGVLSLPYAMSQCGLVFGTICLFLAAVISGWTLDMLVDCARATGRDSFELVGHAAFGETSRKVTIALVFLICWLTMVAYFVLLTDLLVPLAELAMPSLVEMSAEVVRREVVCVAALLLSPMCFKSSLSALRFMCFASVGSVMVVAAAVGFRAVQTFGKDHEASVQRPTHTGELVMVEATYNLWPADWMKALYAFPTFGLSFLCHFNALPTHQELQRPTRYRMRRVIAVTLSLTSVIYLFVSISGYLFGGCYTCGNILLNFKTDDNLITLGRGALGMVLMLNFPLICQPCRNALFRLLSSTGWLQEAGSSFDMQVMSSAGSRCFDEEPPQRASGTAPASQAAPNSPPPGASAGVTSGSSTRASSPSVASPPSARVHVYRRQDTAGGLGQHGRLSPSLEAFDSFTPKDELMRQGAIEPTTTQRCLMTAVLLATALIVSCIMRSIMVVWSVVGSTVCFLVAWILPACFWYKVVGETSGPFRRRAALVLAGATCLLSAVCFVLAILNLSEPPCPLTGRPEAQASQIMME
eukprot:TRINITY_DN11130_c1_g1_i1.p1 TRINITY_DN11130_c1_g1~~TRINITY_DN11130_c1_g1_i1.p1  ORF type:complete len:672 (-),score=110.82 TRINITY_DN11130_c1_g1_i1:40-2055(-)